MARAQLPIELREVGISYRQYDHWAVKGWIQRPSRQAGVYGGTLAFSDEQFSRIVLMTQLVNVLGLPAPRAAYLLDNKVLSADGQHVIIIVGNIEVEVRADLNGPVHRATSQSSSQGDEEQD